MSLTGWGTLLFAFKWVFIGLIYFVLFLLLLAVRREMELRLREGQRPAPTAPGRLKVLHPGGDPALQPGALLPLRPETHLGADPENDVILNDPYVSRRHAVLRWDGAAWWVEDLGSRNGTLLDSRRLSAGTPQRLRPGGRVQIGDMALELVE